MKVIAHHHVDEPASDLADALDQATQQSHWTLCTMTVWFVQNSHRMVFLQMDPGENDSVAAYSFVQEWWKEKRKELSL